MLKNFLIKNIFLLAFIFWILVIILLHKIFSINIYLLIIASIYPLFNLYYNHKNLDKNNDYLISSNKLYWLSNRLHTNSLYIATGVFAINGVTQKLLGKEYLKIIPYYIITIFLGVCFNLVLFNSSNDNDKILITHIKQVFLTYGIAVMSIGILQTLYIINTKKIG